MALAYIGKYSAKILQGKRKKQLKQKNNNYFSKQRTSTENTGLKLTQKFTRSQ